VSTDHLNRVSTARNKMSAVNMAQSQGNAIKRRYKERTEDHAPVPPSPCQMACVNYVMCEETGNSCQKFKDYCDPYAFRDRKWKSANRDKINAGNRRRKGESKEVMV
jgi:hypothetical protein